MKAHCRFVILLALVAAFGGLPRAARAEDTIYVDLSGIDAIPGLTEAQKKELKDRILADVRNNFYAATMFGKGIIRVTDDPNQAAGAARQAHVNNDLGSYVDSHGDTQYNYGEWPHGGREVNIHLRNFTDRHGDDYKSGGNWDLDKLANGIGRTVSHELGHSYSVGHNSAGADSNSLPNKMTEGGLVSSVARANDLWAFDYHSCQVICQNIGKTCNTAADYDHDYLKPLAGDHPAFPNDMDEATHFDAKLSIGGPWASQYTLGWLGRDTDGGSQDGSSQFDFIYKTSMNRDGNDAAMLTFFEEAHGTVQFVLRSPGGTWYPMSLATVEGQDPVIRPDGEHIFRRLHISWDLDSGTPAPEVELTLNSVGVYPYDGGMYNGWEIVPEPATLALLAMGGLAMIRRRK